MMAIPARTGARAADPRESRGFSFERRIPNSSPSHNQHKAITAECVMSQEPFTFLDLAKQFGCNPQDFLAVSGNDREVAEMMASACITIMSRCGPETMRGLLEVYADTHENVQVEFILDGDERDGCLYADDAKQCERCIDRFDCDEYRNGQFKPKTAEGKTLN